MSENLIVEDNTIYEIDSECLKKKREQQIKKEKTENNEKINKKTENKK